MDYKLYRGYILGPGYQNPAYDIYETDIFMSKADVEADTSFHTSESDWEAESWINSEMIGEGTATQADVDRLNEGVTVGNRVKEGVSLLVVDRNGVQLYSTPLGGYNIWEYDSQRELGKAIAEGLPNEAYE